jgi:AraC-like DNA-binding protein
MLPELRYDYICMPHPLTEVMGVTVQRAGFYRSSHHVVTDRIMADYNLIYCVRGSGSYQIAQGQVAISSGDFIALPPEVPHRYQCHRTTGWDVWWVHCSGPYLQTLLEMAGLCGGRTKVSIGVSRLVIGCFSQLVEHAREHTLYTALDVSTALIQLLVEAYKAIRTSSFSKPSVFDVLNYRMTSVEEAAQESGYSKFHFSHLFKTMTGMTPWQYILLLKVTKAKELLVERTHGIAEIARMVGIDDANYFTRLFKKMTGYTPREYQRLTSLREIAPP